MKNEELLMDELEKGRKNIPLKEYLKVATCSVMGAKYGYAAIWILVLAAFFAYIFQEPALRITLLKKISLTEGIRNEVSPRVAQLLYAAVFAGAIAFQAGNFTGAGMALHYVFPFMSILGWAATMAIAALVVCWFGVFKIVENINRILIGSMVLAFVVTAFYSGPGIGEVVTKGFSFRIPGNDYWLLLALLSTTMPPNIPLGFSSFLKLKYFNKGNQISDTKTSSFLLGKNLALASFDLKTSMIITGLISVSIIICSGTVIHPLGITIKGAGDMAIQLTPLLGKFAAVLFAFGLWAAGFSSGIYQVSIQPPIFNDAIGTKYEPRDIKNRVLMTLTSVLPILVIWIFQKTPVAIIITAQALNGLALPLVTIIIWRLCRNKDFMGEFINNNQQNIAYGIIMTLVSFLALRVLLRLVGVL